MAALQSKCALHYSTLPYREQYNSRGWSVVVRKSVESLPLIGRLLLASHWPVADLLPPHWPLHNSELCSPGLILPFTHRNVFVRNWAGENKDTDAEHCTNAKCSTVQCGTAAQCTSSQCSEVLLSRVLYGAVLLSTV